MLACLGKKSLLKVQKARLQSFKVKCKVNIFKVSNKDIKSVHRHFSIVVVEFEHQFAQLVADPKGDSLVPLRLTWNRSP